MNTQDGEIGRGMDRNHCVRIEELVSKLFDEETSQKEHHRLIAELSDLIGVDSEAQEYYVELITLQAMLETELEPLPNMLFDTVDLQPKPESTPYDKLFQHRWPLSIALVLLLLFVVTPLSIYLVSSRNTSTAQQGDTGITQSPIVSTDYSASLTGTYQTRWSEINFRLGDTFQPGDQLTLLSGQCEITFERQAKLICKAPASFTIDGDNSITLHQGEVVVNAPPSAVGFVVKTEDTCVTDLGTEFGVVVSSDQPVGVQVFVGAVVVAGDALQADKRIGAGEAFSFESNGIVSRRSLDATRFQRTMPHGTATLEGEIFVYGAEEGLKGNQPEFAGTLGHDFDTLEPIEVTRLGVFDSESNGLFRDIQVTLWQRENGGTPNDPNDDTGMLRLLELDFTPEDAGNLIGAFRFKQLAKPLRLPVGSYTIVASGYGEEEPNFNTRGESLLPTETANVINLVGTSRFGEDANDFPLLIDGRLSRNPKLKSTPNQYGAASFSFRCIPKPISNESLP